MQAACNLLPAGYKYTDDLLRLERARPLPGTTELPKNLSTITTPANIHEWEKCLAVFPDRRMADFLLRGFKYGFRIGFN